MADTFTRKGVEFIERNKDRPFFLYFATHDIHVPRVPHRAVRRQDAACGVRGDVIVQFDGASGELLDTLDRLKLSRRHAGDPHQRQRPGAWTTATTMARSRSWTATSRPARCAAANTDLRGRHARCR